MADRINTATPLLTDHEGGGNDRGRRSSSWVQKLIHVEESKAQIIYSLPMIFTNLFIYCIPLTSVMFASHLGQLELAGATLANSWATVTGFAFMTGLSGALETLCGQGFGAKSYRMLGIHLQSSCIVSLVFTILISIFWFFTEPVFGLIGQDPNISRQAALYMKYQAPGLLAYGFLQSIVRFCQTQSVVAPLVIFSFVPLVVNIGISYVLVYIAGLGFIGSPIATSISLWIAFLSLGTYVICSDKFKETWTGFSLESFRLMPNPEITTSLVAICVNTESISYMLTYGLSAAASTRVSNELGAGNVQGAKKATSVTVKLSLVLAFGVVLALLVGHDSWVGLFSNSPVIKEEFASLRFFLAASITLDSIQGVLSGVARGCGWQHVVTVINLGTFYLIGMPIAAFCGFVDWFDKWNIFPIFITLAYDNFPEVDKDKCVGLKIVSEVDKAKCFGLKIMRTNLSSNLIPEVYLFPWHYITQGKGFPLDSVTAPPITKSPQLLDDHEDGGDDRERIRSSWVQKVINLEESKAQIIYALPVIFTNLFIYCIPLTSVMFASHLGQLELAGATLANSWATVTGVTFMIGLSGALETLCGQGFGAENYRMLGLHLLHCLINCPEEIKPEALRSTVSRLLRFGSRALSERVSSFCGALELDGKVSWLGFFLSRIDGGGLGSLAGGTGGDTSVVGLGEGGGTNSPSSKMAVTASTFSEVGDNIRSGVCDGTSVAGCRDAGCDGTSGFRLGVGGCNGTNGFGVGDGGCDGTRGHRSRGRPTPGKAAVERKRKGSQFRRWRVIFSIVPLVINIGIAYVLVYIAGLGFNGASIAISISTWIAFLSLGTYVICSDKFKETWTGFSLESFRYAIITMKLSLPSVAMILVLLAGLMAPNPEITTSLVAICVNTEAVSYMLTCGPSAAASTRVSNELGAGNVKGAKKATSVTVKLSLVLSLGLVVALLVGHDGWVGLFSSSHVIKEEFTSLRFFLAATITLDTVQSVLSGVARGCGWQRVVTLINLGTFYQIGMPSAAFCGFKLKLYAKGLWIGMWDILPSSSLLLMTIFRKWKKLDASV
ncbi:LOW QUALITY PROTEIN: hypothetical protein HID58_043321 [Brassica napus]|uniref:Protein DETOXIFICATION n=1 Tax=Brassica napus TaxID=3708 RepID=A0ABQ8BHL5_BRANA|nr:LOW QUALITY PROTEIN: hypothetical protein HID58_043321 [Brassica napus]